MKKQTAVEWLHDTWGNYPDLWSWEKIQEWFAQAKAMEKEQHFQSFIAGGRSRDDFAKGLDFETFPDYYDNTYKTNE